MILGGRSYIIESSPSLVTQCAAAGDIIEVEMEGSHRDTVGVCIPHSVGIRSLLTGVIVFHLA